MRRRTLIGGAVAAPLLAPAIVRAQDTAATLRDLARRATIYLFPVYEMYRTRWNATVNEKNPARGKLNRLRHVPALATPRSRAVTTPNADTLYSSAWLDLSEEPMAVEPDLQIGLYATALPFAGMSGPPWPRVGAAAYVYPITERDPERRFDGESLARLLAWTGRWLDLGQMLLASGTFVRTPRSQDCRFCPFTGHCGEDAQAESRRFLAQATSPELQAFAAFKAEEPER